MDLWSEDLAGERRRKRESTVKLTAEGRRDETRKEECLDKFIHPSLCISEAAERKRLNGRNSSRTPIVSSDFFPDAR